MAEKETGENYDEEKATGELLADKQAKYGSFEEVKEVRKTRDQLACCAKCCNIVLDSIWPTVMVAISLGIPIAMIWIGTIYLDDCPRQRYVPIYLIVFGVFSLIKALSTLGQRIAAHYKQAAEIPCDANALDALIGCFLTVWFIAGNFWVYGIFNDYSSDPTSEDYCNETVYEFAFWITSLVYLLVWTSMIVCCCVRICMSTVFDIIWDCLW